MKYYDIVRSYCDKQHGVVARRQLMESGVDPSTIKRFINSSLIEVVQPGIYVVTRDLQSWRQQAAIATLSFGEDSYLSHESSLIYVGLLKDASRVFDVKSRTYVKRRIRVGTSSRKIPGSNVSVHRNTLVEPNEIIRPKIGIPYLSTSISFVYAAKYLSVAELDFTLEKALHSQLIQIDSLLRNLDRFSKVRGICTSKLKTVLESYTGPPNEVERSPTESVLEKRVQRVLDKNRTFKFIPQFQVEIFGNRYRLDFADPKYRLAIEVDGFEFHRNRETYDRDRFRQNELIAAGWRVVRVTSKFSDAQILDALSSFAH